MHDPLTVASEIKSPFKIGKWNYRPPLITIWHVDPESDGSDDSCGWFSPKLTENEISEIKVIVGFEAKYIFQPTDTKDLFTQKTDAFGGIYFFYERIAWRLYRKKLAPRYIPQIISLCSGPSDSFVSTFKQDVVSLYDIERMCFFIARSFKRMERKWYQHPRYHFWHYRIQVHALQHFKRWAFGRCCQCGDGFKWNESVSSASWSSKGPQWFRTESDIYHSWHSDTKPETAKAGD